MAKKKPTPPGRPPVERDTFTGRVGAIVRAKREAKKLSVDRAAGRAGVPASTWYAFESGRHLTLERLPAIAKVLGCKVRLLIPPED